MRCKGCGYSLFNQPGRTCPECGRPFLPSEFEFRPNAVEFCCTACGQQYFGTDGSGLPEPRAFDCVRCGVRCELDAMLLRAAPGVDPDRTERRMVPYEDPAVRSRVARFLGTVRDGMLRPVMLGQAVASSCSGRRATVFAMWVAAWVVVPTWVAGLAFMALNGIRGGGIGAQRIQEMAVATAFAVAAFAALLAAALGLTALAWCALRLVGERLPFAKAWAVAAYTSGPMLVLAVPCVGPYCGSTPALVWWAIVAGIGLAALVPGWKAMVAIGAAVMLVLGGLAVAVASVVMSITGAIQAAGAPPTPAGPPPAAVAPMPVAEDGAAAPGGSGIDDGVIAPDSGPLVPLAEDAP